MYKRKDGAPARVVAGVPSRSGDPAAEQEPSSGVIEEGLPGGARAVAARFGSISIVHNAHARNGCGVAPEIPPAPYLGKAGRTHEVDRRRQPPLTMCHNLGQFSYTRFCT